MKGVKADFLEDFHVCNTGLPLFVGHLISNYTDDVWMHVLALRELVEAIPAPEWSEGKIGILQAWFEDECVCLFPNKSLKCKHRFSTMS